MRHVLKGRPNLLNDLHIWDMCDTLTITAAYPLNNLWSDTVSSFMSDKLYIVQTNVKQLFSGAY
jgi:hypothetical protein